MTTPREDWMTPPDADLRDFQYLPLDVIRLRDSDLMDQPGEVVKLALKTWCVAWHQVPAGTLPDNDVALARLLGYGIDVKKWRAVRKKVGLYGWKPGPNGRLYHEIVCEKASEALEKRTKKSKSGKTGAANRWKNKETGDGTAIPAANSTENAKEKKEKKGEEGKETRAMAKADERDLVGLLQRACGIAGINQAKAVNWLGIATTWVATGLTDDEITTVIDSIAGRDGYKPPSTLAYFTKAIEGAAAELKANRPNPDRLQETIDRYVWHFARYGKWDDAFGPKPGAPGCRASPEVLRKHGFTVEGDE